MRPLYNITNEYMQAYDELMSIPDMPIEAISDTLESIQADFENKAINVAAFIKNMEIESKSLKEIEDSIKKRRQGVENKANNLKNYLLENMQSLGIREIKTSPMFVIKIGMNPGSVFIDNAAEIPAIYKNVEILETVDKAAIAKEIRSGNEVAGAHLEQSKKLTIK